MKPGSEWNFHAKLDGNHQGSQEFGMNIKRSKIWKTRSGLKEVCNKWKSNPQKSWTTWLTTPFLIASPLNIVLPAHDETLYSRLMRQMPQQQMQRMQLVCMGGSSSM